MKKLINITLLSLLSLQFMSCDKDIDKFDNDTNYIYFGVPFVQDQYGRDTKERVDSVSHSFALDDLAANTYTFKIAVNTIGLSSNEDRAYSVKVVTEASTADNNDWDATCLNNTHIKQNALTDTIELVVNRSDALSKEWRHLVLQLQTNDNFQIGPDSLQFIKISFSNMIQEPAWWAKWKGYFGEFCREKYAKWKEIYYLGADPNTDDKGNQYYWENMPSIPFYGKSTLPFVQILKVYFVEHEVYPDGDTTKPRILLP